MSTENPPTCVITMRPGKRASRRAEVKHVFWDLKIRFGYVKNRYRGLAKNTARLTFLTAIANVIRGDA